MAKSQSVNFLSKAGIPVFILLIIAGACDLVSDRPDDWATPLYNSHFRNAYRVSDHLYRSAQPGLAAYKEFHKRGVAVSLNLTGTPFDRKKLQHIGITQIHIPVSAGSLTEDQVIEALKVIKNSESPVLVHCEWGADRSGAVVAFYRMVFEGWPKDKAIDEMVNGGYGFHLRYQNLIDLINNADISVIKRRLERDSQDDKVGVVQAPAD